MESIRFKASFGDYDSNVELAYLIGNYYHIFIDRFYYGQIINRDGTWYVLPQNPDEFSMDDMDAISDRINAAKPG